MLIPKEHIHIHHTGSLATLTFMREELLYDIKNICFVEGDIKDGDEHSKHQIIDVCEDGNVNRVTRVLNLTFEQCVDKCYPYTKAPAHILTSRDDELEESEEYVMRLHFPNGMSRTTIDLLEKCIHEILVCRGVEDWLSITEPTASEKWGAKAEKLERDIPGILNRRMHPVRRRLHPF